MNLPPNGVSDDILEIRRCETGIGNRLGEIREFPRIKKTGDRETWYEIVDMRITKILDLVSCYHMDPMMCEEIGQLTEEEMQLMTTLITSVKGCKESMRNRLVS